MSDPPGSLDELSPARVDRLLQTVRYGRSYELLAATGSTNDVARERAVAGATAGHVVVADQQSAGRGSHGRPWLSPAGTDLYVSIVDGVSVPLSQLPPLTLAVGLGVAEALDDSLGEPHNDGQRARVKWPNDVWIGHRKCAGILVEVSSDRNAAQTLVIGIGINVNRRTFPPGLEHPATSLAAETGDIHDRGQVLARLLAHTETWVRRFEAEGPAPVVQALEARLLYLDQEVTCGQAEGRLLGVGAGGELRLMGTAGEVSVISGRLRLKAVDRAPDER